MRRSRCWMGVLGLGLLCSLPLGAESVPEPTFEAGLSLVLGDATELVLRDGTYNAPVSRLVWPVAPTPALEFAVDWPWASWTSTAARLRFLSPLSSGTMIDEDWNVWVQDQSNNWWLMTKGWSAHSARLTAHVTAEALQTLRLGAFTASLGAQYRWMSWEGWDGEGLYQYDGIADDEVSFSGPIIDYRQQWVMPFVGAGWTFSGFRWSVTPSLRVGPYAWGFDRDDHNYAGAATSSFLDNVRGGVYGQLGLEAVFGCASKRPWGLRGAWEFAWGATGETIEAFTIQAPSGTHYTFASNPNAAGAWFREASFTVFVRN